MPKTKKVSAPLEGKPPAPRRKPRTGKSSPTREEIQLRAYQIYLERGGAPGNELEDWMQAERELTGRYGNAPRSAKARAEAA